MEEKIMHNDELQRVTNDDKLLSESLNIVSEMPKTTIKLEKQDVEIKEYENESSDKKGIFPTDRFWKNFWYLFEKSEIKIGELEKKSGNSIGYTSRLKKEGYKNAPNIDFISTVASVFHVPIEALLFGNLTDMSPQEDKLVRFMESLIADTRTDKMVWDIIYNPYEKENEKPDIIFFESMFYPKEEIVITSKCYRAVLPYTLNSVQIMCVTGTETEDKERQYMYFEVYLEDELAQLSPLCCSANTKETIAMTIRNLYREIQLSESNIHINESNSLIIDTYLRGVESRTMFK